MSASAQRAPYLTAEEVLAKVNAADPAARARAVGCAKAAWRMQRKDRPTEAQRAWTFAQWCEECYRIRTWKGELVPLRLNYVQRRIREVEEEELRTRGEARLFVLKGRQGGVTTGEQARNLFQIWSEARFDAMTLAHKDEDMLKIFQITTRAIANFPPALLPKMGARDTREISFTKMDSTFWTGTAGAKRTGRGITLKRVHGSEAAFWPELDVTLGALRPTLVPGATIVLETTASGYDSEAHRFLKRAQKGENSYRTLFFPWWQCDAERYRLPILDTGELGELDDEEKTLVRVHGLDLEQIKWRRENIRDMGRDFFLQEYAEDEETCWLTARGGTFYDLDLLKDLLNRAPEPLSQDLGGSLEIYGQPQEGETVIRGADTAEGVDGDASTFVDRAFPSWRLLRTYKDNRVEPEEFAYILNSQGHIYGEEVPVFQVIEKNAHGITVLRKLRDTHKYPNRLLYHRAPLDQTTEEPLERLGWVTTGESKPLLLDAGRELLGACRDGLAGLPCAGAIRDAFSIRRDANGRVELNGRDLWVAECLAWIGRAVPRFTGVKAW